MFRWWLCMAFLLSADIALALQITEVMYNPQGEDDGREFVEVFDESARNLSGFFVMDSASNDTLALLREGNSPYAVIVEDTADLAALNVNADAAIYTIGATIGNGLGNTQDTVALYDRDGMLLDRIAYDGTLANGNGRSLALVEGVWGESEELGGSPGRGNAAFVPPALNSTNGSNPCSGNFSLATDKMLYSDGEKVLMHFSVPDEDLPFTLMYWVEDLHGNILRAPKNTTNANAKTFTARADEADQVLLVRAQYAGCGRTIDAEQQIIVKGSGIPQNSSIIFRSAPASASFGDTIPLELEILRANTRKSTVEVSVEQGGVRVSRIAKISVTESLQRIITPLELELYENCNGKYPMGNYHLVAQGLDTSATVPILLTNDSCVPEATSGTALGTAAAQRLPQLDLSFADFPNGTETGAAHIAVVAVGNPSDRERSADIWSYAYRGSKSLSGDREGNRQRVSLAPSRTTEIPLEIVLDDTVPGSALYKVRLLEEGRKTPIELKATLEIAGGAQDSAAPTAAPSAKAASASSAALAPITGNAVYYSKSAKIKQLALYALLAACFVVISLLVWKGE